MPAADPPELTVAVVGSGPSGFYAAGFLLGRDDFAVRLDMFDRLPTPWGLVRAGVAPDHPNIKAVTRIYEKTAAHPRFRFFGNVEVGTDISRQELLEHYHAVIYAFGARADKRMGIPGEDLPGSWPATEFVAWYNGHPDARHHEFDLSCERAVVVGNGNVAADVARMLALTPEELGKTDTADHAIAGLTDSRIREIVVLGRRGPAQAAFTNPELRELGEMLDADVVVDPAEAALDAESAAAVAGDEVTLTVRRNVEIISDYARRPPGQKPRRIVLRFLVSPVEIVGTDRVEAIRVVRNELVRAENGSLRAQATDDTETIPAGLVFRSIGYRGVALPGLPFDERSALVPNQGGRVLGDDGSPLPGEYVVGWIKRGPTGIIGTNKKDAQETVNALIADAQAQALPAPAHPEPEAVEALLAQRKPTVVSYAGWEAIDRDERARGEPQGRPRVKHCSWEDLLAAAGAASIETRENGGNSSGHAAVTRYLDELDVSYQVVVHPASSTVADQARAAGVPLDRAAQAVPLVDGGDFRVALIPGSRALDLDKLRAETGKDLRPATEAEVRAALGGREAGVLPPLAPLLRAPEVMDRRLLDHEQILISGGDESHGVLIDPNDLVELVQPRIADISRG